MKIFRLTQAVISQIFHYMAKTQTQLAVCVCVWRQGGCVCVCGDRDCVCVFVLV